MNFEEEDRWLLAEGEENGNFLLFRARKEIPPGSLKMQYPLLISVYWPYDAAANEGMPDDELNDEHFDLELALQPLDTPEFSHLMLVITGAGQKEWHYYAKQEDPWMDQLNELLSEHPEYPLEIEVSEDPDWSLYATVIEGISQTEQELEGEE